MTTREKFLADLDNLTQRSLYFSNSIQEENKIKQATVILNGMEKEYIKMNKSDKKFSIHTFVDYMKQLFSHSI